tara:strand:- start:3005 stop:3223 length:219 start_codon:yes stop_codon:yes gene_type:complete
MNSITQSQYENLINGKVDSTLDTNIQSDIKYVKTILLTQQDNEFFVEFIELDELCEEEITECMNRGTMVTIS